MELRNELHRREFQEILRVFVVLLYFSHNGILTKTVTKTNTVSNMNRHVRLNIHELN